jgi:vancomycin resistance protein VanW
LAQEQLELPITVREEVPLKGIPSHPILEEGKRTNIAIAARHLHGRQLAPNQPLSFWRAIGAPTRGRGFVAGVEVREGCVIPSIGGGLCLLSSALFRLAARLNWSIIERHGHTVGVPGHEQVDATIMWPHVDLVVAPRTPSILEVSVSRTHLSLVARSKEPIQEAEVCRRRVTNASTTRKFVSEIVRKSPGKLEELLGVDHKTIVETAYERNCITCNRADCVVRESYLKVLQ